MERSHQQQWLRVMRSWLSYKNATIFVCLLNIITALLLLHVFLSASPSYKFNSSKKALYRHMKESEEIRRAMVPVDLIKRVTEIRKEAYVETEAVQQKYTKPTAAVDLISRLNDLRSYSDGGSLKALEEWRKRKMERARHRSMGKNGTGSSQL